MSNKTNRSLYLCEMSGAFFETVAAERKEIVEFKEAAKREEEENEEERNVQEEGTFLVEDQSEEDSSASFLSCLSCDCSDYIYI